MSKFETIYEIPQPENPNMGNIPYPDHDYDYDKPDSEDTIKCSWNNNKLMNEFLKKTEEYNEK